MKFYLLNVAKNLETSNAFFRCHFQKVHLNYYKKWNFLNNNNEQRQAIGINSSIWKPNH
jgi:hypothetical protein